MTGQQSRKYQRNGVRGKGLTIWLPPALRARIEEAAAAQNTSLSAVIAAVLKAYFLGTTEEQEEAAK